MKAIGKLKQLPVKKRILFIIGAVLFTAGFGILAFYGGRYIFRHARRAYLLKTSVVLEIPDLDIKEPVLEGTELDVLAYACGHFTESGDGNYCIAGHSSPYYKYAFNALQYVENGMEIRLYDKNGSCTVYHAAESFIVEPSETWILNGFGDERITLVTCTDDGSQRRIVVGKK